MLTDFFGFEGVSLPCVRAAELVLALLATN
jgi:hypothetical protein